MHQDPELSRWLRQQKPRLLEVYQYADAYCAGMELLPNISSIRLTACFPWPTRAGRNGRIRRLSHDQQFQVKSTAHKRLSYYQSTAYNGSFTLLSKTNGFGIHAEGGGGRSCSCSGALLGGGGGFPAWPLFPLTTARL